jgi:hypothetical protein
MSQSGNHTYALDAGVLFNRETAIVEVNPPYSIGAYGLDPAKYFKFLQSSWQSMIDSNLPSKSEL